MILFQRFVPGLAIASYVVADERSGEAAVIDPTRDVEDFLEYARDNSLAIRHVVETHVHADFLSGARELKERLGGEAAVYCSGEGGAEWTPPYADHVVSEGDTIRMGSVRLEAVATPGHTPEHVSWALFDESRSAETPWILFTGDFLFVGDVGRPDLLGEEARDRLANELHSSLFERLRDFPDITEIFPAHGAGSLCGKAIGSRRSSTLGYERRFNPAFVARPREEWVHSLLRDMPLAPPYFRRMKKVNVEGPRLLGSDPPGRRRRSAREVHARVCEECLIVDVRTKEAFAAAHIPGSINIPLGPSLPVWAGWVLPYERPTLFVLDSPRDLPEVTVHLLRVGFDDLRGYIDGGIEAWEMAGYPLETLDVLSVHALGRELRHAPSSRTVLDVRTDAEWNVGHIEGAVHVHGGTLQEQYARVPRARPVAVVCGSGYRASIAASFLKRQGYEQVANVMGGMSAWNAARLPVVTG